MTKNRIDVEDVTYSLVGYNYPRKLIKHLENVHNAVVKKYDDGIYYINGIEPKGQIIVIDQLPPKVNRFVRLITRKLLMKEEIEMILEDFNNKKSDTRIEHILGLVNEVNLGQLMEVYEMQRQYTARELEITEIVMEKMGLKKKFEEEGIEKGIEKGIEQTAIKMLKDNMSVELISKYTRLKAEDIIKLKENMK